MLHEWYTKSVFIMSIIFVLHVFVILLNIFLRLLYILEVDCYKRYFVYVCRATIVRTILHCCIHVIQHQLQCFDCNFAVTVTVLY